MIGPAKVSLFSHQHSGYDKIENIYTYIYFVFNAIHVSSNFEC